MGLIKCFHCKELKEDSLFYVDKQKKNGLSPRCKICKKLSINKDKRKLYEKKYRENNPIKRALIVKNSMKNNAEHHKEVRRLYLKTIEGMASYKKYTQKRYALIKSAVVEDVDIFQLYEEFKGICFYCSKYVKFSDIHVDHYYPISKGGKHEKSNLRISCSYCNLSKGAKHPEELSYQMV